MRRSSVGDTVCYTKLEGVCNKGRRNVQVSLYRKLYTSGCLLGLNISRPLDNNVPFRRNERVRLRPRTEKLQPGSQQTMNR